MTALTNTQRKVLRAISERGEASGYEIYRHMRSCRWATGFSGIYPALIALEHNGFVTARWGVGTAERGWHRPRLYSVTEKAKPILEGPPPHRTWWDRLWFRSDT